MAIDNLQLSIRKLKANENVQRLLSHEINTEVACNIINIIFKYVNICLKEDKSKRKINKLEKSFIQSIINSRTVDGIKAFVKDMNDKEVELLLTEIQKELDTRNLLINENK